MPKSGTIALFFAMLALIVPAMSDSPWAIGELDAQVSFSGSLNVEKTSASYSANLIEASFYIVPQPSSLQSAEQRSISPATYSIETDQFGSPYLKFRWANPAPGKLDYGASWNVDVKRLEYAITSAGQLGAETPESVDAYLKPDNLTKWTGFMKAKAESITEGSGSALEAARRLTEWISQELNYDLTCFQGSYGAEWVFRERRGVCDEYTNLFVSLARSIGIPSRYAQGLVYSGTKWDYHAWAEVYIEGSWVPVDPTYNEVGFVDSSHIVLANVAGDSDVKNRLKWEGANLDVSFEDDSFEVSQVSNSSKSLIGMSADVQEEASGSEIMQVSVHVTNLANSFVVATCSVNMPIEMLLLDSAEKSVLLPSGGEDSLTWKIASPRGLNTQFLHKMPIEVSCFPGSAITKEIQIDPRSSKPLLANASIRDLTVINSSSVSVEVLNEGTKQLSDLSITLCLLDGAEACFNKSVAALEPGKIAYAVLTGLNLTEGDKVSAQLNSADMESSRVEATLGDLTEPELPEETGEDGTKPPPGLSNLQTPASPASKGGEDLAIMIAIAAVALILIAVFAIVLRRR